MIRGLELTERYYREYGEPMLASRFPELQGRIAVGLVGEGSECFGYDDAISRDHDFGPSFCMWLTDEDYAAYGQALQAAYDELPGEFMGMPARQVCQGGAGRVGALQTSVFFRGLTGASQVPAELFDWLRLRESGLACATNGKVFRDDLGQFSAVRNGFLAYYPEDVRRKKLAACAAKMAQSGQYNYARCMRRGETGAAYLMLADFVRSCLRMFYLLERRYMPFEKWAFRGLSDFRLLPRARQDLLALTAVPEDRSVWPQDDPMKYSYALNTADRRVALIEEICADVIAELGNQQLSSAGSDFLLPHGIEILRSVGDERLRRTNLMEG